MDDFEMDALLSVARVFEPLDIETRQRVLQWATDRFVETPKRRVTTEVWAAVDAQVAAYREHAKSLGLDEGKLAHALAHVRRTKGLAPIGVDQDPVDTESKALESVSA